MTWPEKRKDDNDESPKPGDLKKAIARLALKFGGFDKVAGWTLEQMQLATDALSDEREFLARIAGCEVEEEVKEATEDDLNMLLGMFGN